MKKVVSFSGTPGGSPGLEQRTEGDSVLDEEKDVTLPWSSSAFAHAPGRLMRQCLKGRNATVTDLSMVEGVSILKVK